MSAVTWRSAEILAFSDGIASESTLEVVDGGVLRIDLPKVLATRMSTQAASASCAEAQALGNHDNRH
jgi:hypothetical protein